MKSSETTVEVSTSMHVSCSFCESNQAKIFFSLPDMPTQDGVFVSTYKEAFEVDKGDILLSYCHNCGSIFNEGHEAEKIHFDTYDFSLAHSPSFRSYVEETTDYLIEKYDLSGKNILGVGCGEGYFLKELCRKGQNRGVGIDSGFKDRKSNNTENVDITFIRDYYSPKYKNQKVDFLSCRLVIDLLNDPFAFLRMVRDNLNGQEDAIVYFEVPHAEHNLKELCIWNFVYEHRSWFTQNSLKQTFELCGFEVLDIHPCWHKEFLAIEARPGSIKQEHSFRPDQEVHQLVMGLSQALDQLKAETENRLDKLRKEGKKLSAWGAGSRAVTFFNMFDTNDWVSEIVDINKNRQGKYLPGSGQKVIAPDQLRAINPDLLIITNPTYADEIKAQVKALGLEPEFWVI